MDISVLLVLMHGLVVSIKTVRERVDIESYGQKMCQRLCDFPTCKSLFSYNNLTCVVSFTTPSKHTQRHVVLARVKGTFGGNCTGRRDCGFRYSQCLYNKCVCVILYSYDFSLNKCIQGCKRYGKRFTRYRMQTIYNNDDVTKYFSYKTPKNIAASGCRKLCLADMKCVSYDFGLNPYHHEKGWMCNLCHTYDGFALSVSRSETFDIYYRHCAWEESRVF